MAFCQFSSESVISNTTNVDNIFINEFLPYANDTCVKVYLYGLYKCNTANSYDNTLESFSNILGIDKEDVYSAFLYWQDQGLVQVLATDPFEVIYNPVKSAISNVKKYKKDKYANFNLQLETILAGRTITLNEYYQYYEFMEQYRVEPEALILVLEYCVRAKGIKVGYSYVLTIAKNWAEDGFVTFEKVDEKLRTLEQNSSIIGEIFSVLKINRIASIDEKELVLKWQNEYDFNTETILGVCKDCKKRKMKSLNFDKLDDIFSKYYEMKLSSLKEIQNYEAEKEGLFKISKGICKALGLYYENLEPVSSTYTSKWVFMGYSDEVLFKIANYCFKQSIRNLDGMDAVINKFFKLGVVTIEALEQYFETIILQDGQIKTILDKLGLVRNVNKLDRDFYKNWTQEWHINEELINHAVELSKTKLNPMNYMNKLLSVWHSKGFTNVEQTKGFEFEEKNQEKPKTTPQNYKNRQYTKEELNAFFDNLEEVEL